MSSGGLKNQMQDTTKTNLFQDDTLNNEKTTNVDQERSRSEIQKLHNNLENPSSADTATAQQRSEPQIKECDARGYGNCDGEIKTYGRLHCDCLLIGEHHNFCRYHYKTAEYCPVHPCFKLLKDT